MAALTIQSVDAAQDKTTVLLNGVLPASIGCIRSLFPLKPGLLALKLSRPGLDLNQLSPE